MAFESINPATGETIAVYEEHTDQEVEQIIDRSLHAHRTLRALSFEQRAQHMRQAASYLRNNIERYGRLITDEMGKPVVDGEAEIEKCAWVCDYYADNAEHFLAPIPRESGATESYIAFEPIGPVLAVMPWNFPFWQVFRFAAPALMAGNTGLLKHASNVSGCALAIEEVFSNADFPQGAFATLLVSSKRVAGIIEDERVRAVTLTGSEPAGASVASTAGRVIKKTVLELGGSDPFIVLADADIDAAVEVAIKARNQNTGQSCIAAKRFIVADAVADEFTEKFVQGVAALKVGDPRERDTQVGPLARVDLMEAIHDQVERSVQAGAKVLTGGHRLELGGAFYAPTVLGDVRPGMPAFDEETFGPLAAVIRAANEDEAIELANQTTFGLGSALWTRDTEKAKQLARRIEAGSVFINGMVASDPRLPFGGVKHSGYGRELSEFGIREFVNIQTVWIGPKKEEGIPEAE